MMPGTFMPWDQNTWQYVVRADDYHDQAQPTCYPSIPTPAHPSGVS